ncbi:MAG: FG-GAP repeat protein, partial [Acidimicrobiaceae bacterium]
NGTVTVANGFTYNATPTISSIVPNNGPVAGGQVIVITSPGVSGTVTVQLGSVTVPTQNVTVGAGTITVLTPPGAASGPVDVTVDTSVQGTTVVPNGYTYNPGATITAVTPNNGPVDAATPIVITGTGFLSPSTVTIGGLAAGVTTVVSPTQITATAQPFTLVGAQDVVVTSNLAGVATLPDGFTYTPVFANSTQATPAGGAPNDVATGDFNGDGVQDFVVANQALASFSVLISGVRTDFPVTGTEPANVSVADMNLDGRPDVVTTNKVSNDMNVFLNVMALPTNTPTFSAPVVFAMAGTPGQVEARDFNGDGKPDIVTVSESTGNILARLNTTTPGAGLSLSGVTTIGAGLASPAGFAVADFDRDGLPDLAISESAAGANRARVFRNTTGPGGGTPGFTQVATLNAGTRTVAVATGDLNGDGRPDVVVANRQDDTFTTFVASGIVGTIGFSAQPAQSTGAGPVAIVIADLDGGGVPDVITANDGASTVSVRVNQTVPGTANVTYSAQADRPCGATPGTLIALDINNDGKQDLAVPNRTGATVTLLTNL